MIKSPESLRLLFISGRFQIFTGFSQGLIALQLLQSGLTLVYVHDLPLGMSIMLSGFGFFFCLFSSCDSLLNFWWLYCFVCCFLHPTDPITSLIVYYYNLYWKEDVFRQDCSRYNCSKLYCPLQACYEADSPHLFSALSRSSGRYDGA